MKNNRSFAVFLSMLLCLSLVFSMLPFTALAEGETDGETGEPTEETVALTEENDGQDEERGSLDEEGDNLNEEGGSLDEEGDGLDEEGDGLDEEDNGQNEESDDPNKEGDSQEEESDNQNEEDVNQGEENVTQPESQNPTAAAEIVLDYETVSLDALDTFRLSAAVYPADCDQTVVWTSSDPSVATVDASGLVTAVGRGVDKQGIATISAASVAKAEDGSELVARCYVTVRSDGILAENAEQLNSEHPYEDGETCFWEFTLEEAENLALSFATETDLGAGDFLLLQFGDNEQISYSEDNIGLLAGQTLAITGNTVRIWLISDDDGNTGWGFQVTEAVEAEENEELAQSQDFTDPLAYIDVPRLMTAKRNTLSSAPSASVTLDRTELELEALDKSTLTATIEPADNPNFSIVWSSTDESVVTVIDGEVQAQTAHGTAVVTATVMYDDGNGNPVEAKDADGNPAAASCTVTVTNDAAVVTDWTQLESDHPYSRPVDQFWLYKDPTAGSLTLTFDIQSMLAPGDTVIVTDGKKNQVGVFTGNLLVGKTVTVYDNTVRIYLKSVQTESTNEYGFKVFNVYAPLAEGKYRVIYYANGGTNPPEEQIKDQDIPLKLSEEKPTRSHYTFKGWSTERASGRVAWYPGDEYDENADLTLYAVWDRVSTFNSSNRGASASPYYGPTGSSGQTQTYPKTPINLDRPETNYDKDVLHIRTVEDLIAFSENCSLDTWSDHLPVVLDNDLSLSDVDFQPIPLFNGSFDGRGHSIFDLTLTDPLAPCGLFLETGRDGIVKNLSVTGTVMPGGDNNMTGGLVGLNRGCLLNCSFTGTVAGKLETGGLVGRNEVTGIVTACRSNATVSGLNQIGGICGMNYGTLISCESNSYVNTESVDPSLHLDDIDTSSLLNFVHSLTTDTAGITTDTGGICGYNEGFIEVCINHAPIGYSRLGYNVGGIAGRSKGYINGSRNEGAVYGRRDVGGIVGQAEPYIEVTQPGNLTAGLSYRVYALHQSINDAIHDAEVLSNDISGQLSGLSGFLGPVEQAFRELSINDPNSVTALREVIVNMVSGMAGQIQSMSASMGEGSDVLTQDLQAVSDNLDALSGSALQTVDLLSAKENEDIIVDDSASGTADMITLGKITDCRNVGEISGENNVGGIAGSMALENATDPELDLTTTNAVLRNRFSYRSVVSRSVNNGPITAWYGCAGGIVGKTDIGYISNCAAYSSVGLEDGAYAGGISGLCYGTVDSCVSRCRLYGTKYIGGILGNGYTSTGDDDKPSVVSSCYSLVEIQDRPQFSGAISGGAEGEYRENYFVPAGFAGLNKLSVYGCAEPILFSVFNSVLTLPEESKVFTLRFVVDGETIKEINFEYGASFGREVFPAVESRDGAYAVWDRADLTNLRFDTTVTAVYRRSETALSSDLNRENGRPIAYVIGQFQEGDAVSAEILPTQEEDIHVFRKSLWETIKEQIRSIFREPDYSICVSVAEKLRLSFPEDGLKRHTVHYMTPDGSTQDYRLYLKQGENYERLPLEVFGSYYSFEVPGNSPEICAVSTVQSWWFLLYIAGAILILVLLIGICVKLGRKLRARPKKKKQSSRVNLRQKIRSHRKGFMLACIAVLAILGAAAALLQSGWLQSGFAGYRVLKNFITSETDIESDIRIRTGSDELNLSTTVQQITQDGNTIICADQYGIDLYIANGALYLENGRAFRLMNDQIDQKNLLRLALDSVRRGRVVKQTDGDTIRYSTEISSDALEEVLALFVSKEIDAVFRGDELHAEIDIRNGELSEIRFAGEGVTGNGENIRFDAVFKTAPLSDRPEVPQAVLDAIQSGEAEALLLTDEALVLFAAWIKNDRADSVDAAIDVRAECGVLSLDESYSYFRQKVQNTDIHCVSNRLFRVYFTKDATCTSSGKPISTAEMRLVDTAQLIPIVREFFLRGSYSCEELGSGKLYTITVKADEIGGLVEQVIPELKDLNVSYEDCTVSVSVRDGSLYSLELECGGSVKIVTKDVDANATAIVHFEKPTEHDLPSAVRKTLLTKEKTAS